MLELTTQSQSAVVVAVVLQVRPMAQRGLTLFSAPLLLLVAVLEMDM
jgi:hypothetical protein